jgi:hypothetical protein
VDTMGEHDRARVADRSQQEVYSPVISALGLRKKFRKQRNPVLAQVIMNQVVSSADRVIPASPYDTGGLRA